MPLVDARVIVIAWIISGLVGFAYRAYLFRKYFVDRKISLRIGASAARVYVSTRGIQASLIHLTVKSIIIAIGLGDPALYNSQPIPTSVALFGLLAIPWMLNLDGFLEHEFQKWLIQDALDRSPTKIMSWNDLKTGSKE